MTPENRSPSFFFMLAAIAIVIIAFVLRNYIGQQHIPQPAIVGQPTPNFKLPSLLNPATSISNQSLRGRVYLLNFWASWCNACKAEHSVLLMINTIEHVPILGIAYKDNEQHAREWLQEAGNPFALVASDYQGTLGNPFQLLGTPETFIVDKNGLIRYRYIGTLARKDWEMVLKPLIKKYEEENVHSMHNVSGDYV